MTTIRIVGDVHGQVQPDDLPFWRRAELRCEENWPRLQVANRGQVNLSGPADRLRWSGFSPKPTTCGSTYFARMCFSPFDRL